MSESSRPSSSSPPPSVPSPVPRHIAPLGSSRGRRRSRTPTYNNPSSRHASPAGYTPASPSGSARTPSIVADHPWPRARSLSVQRRGWLEEHASRASSPATAPALASPSTFPESHSSSGLPASQVDTMLEHDPSVSKLSEEDRAQERAHFLSVVKAFEDYLPQCLAANNSRRLSYYAIPRAHQALLSDAGPELPGPVLTPPGSPAGAEVPSVLNPPRRGFNARLDEIDDRLRRNADVLDKIVADSREFLGEDLSSTLQHQDNLSKADSVSSSLDLGQSSGRDGSSWSIDTGDDSASGSGSGSGTASGSGSGQSADTVRAQLQSVRVGDEEVTMANTTNQPSGAVASSSDASQDKREGQRRRRKIKRREANDKAPYGLDKIKSTLKQFVREWSAEGVEERQAAYGPIIEAVMARYGTVPEEQRAIIRILVPGAGLGRLAFEFARRGFSAQGNEFSFVMLLSSYFVLNKTTRVGEHTIYPYVHSCSNWRTAADLLRPVSIPDVRPSELSHDVEFSMVAGEFIDVYSAPHERGNWDVIATCFFIDTARNLVRYLEVFNHALALGGVWVNLGPLLWHYEGAGGIGESQVSLELTLEEVLSVVKRMGFEIEEQRSLPPQTYTGNSLGMLTYTYHPEMWVAKKVAEVRPSGPA